MLLQIQILNDVKSVKKLRELGGRGVIQMIGVVSSSPIAESDARLKKIMRIMYRILTH